MRTIKMCLVNGWGYNNKTVLIDISSNPPEIIFKVHYFGGIFLEEFRVPIHAITNIGFDYLPEQSLSKGFLWGWLGSFISARSTLLTAALGLRQKRSNIVFIEFSHNNYSRHRVLLSNHSSRKTYKNYIALCEELHRTLQNQ